MTIVETTVFRLLETEYWEEGWNEIGLFWTREAAEQEIKNRKADLKKNSKLSDEEFDSWWHWMWHWIIEEKTISGKIPY